MISNIDYECILLKLYIENYDEMMITYRERAHFILYFLGSIVFSLQNLDLNLFISILLLFHPEK